MHKPYGHLPFLQSFSHAATGLAVVLNFYAVNTSWATPSFGPVWPSGTREVKGTVSQGDITLFQRSMGAGEMGRWDLYDNRGNIVASQEIHSSGPSANSALGDGRQFNDYQIGHADLARGCKALLTSVAGRSTSDFSKVALTHCHVNLPKLGWFSGPDRQVGAIYRDYLNRSGLSSLPFEMRLLYRNSFRGRNPYEAYPGQEIGLKVMEIPSPSQPSH